MSDDNSQFRSVGNDADTIPSRRRPGRTDDVAPALIPLLRGAASLDAADAVLPENPLTMADNLAPARGIIAAVGLAIPMWALLIWGVFALLH